MRVLGEILTLCDPDLDALRLNPDDVARVAEFFDRDVDAAFAFVRTIWLPDARTTAIQILSAIRAQEWSSLLYLCDHLREGARCVGAQRIVALASAIEEASKSKCIEVGLAHVQKLRESLDALTSLLLECAPA